MGDSLMVRHGDLLTFGTTLVDTGTTLNSDLTDLDNNMAVIPEAWPDDNGVLTASTFSEFITKAKPINEELIKLGNYAKTSADAYVTIESTHANNMK